MLGWKDKEGIHLAGVHESSLTRVSFQVQVHMIKLTRFFSQKARLLSVKIHESGYNKAKLLVQEVTASNRPLLMSQSTYSQIKIDFPSNDFLLMNVFFET